MRSYLSDPVGAGVNAFATITDVVGREENRAMRRELMDREKAQQDIQMQAQTEQLKAFREDREFLRKTRMNEEELMKLAAAKETWAAGGTLSDEDFPRIIKAGLVSERFKDVPPEEWPRLNKNLQTLRTGIDKLWPTLNGQLSKGQGVYVTDEQAPEWFNALNVVYGKEINRGQSEYGAENAAEKRITRIYLDPRNGTMTPYLRVKNAASGDEYYAPMTYDRGTNPDSPVLQIPYQLFAATLNADVDMSKMLDAAMIRLGSKETLKVAQAQRETLKKNDVFAAGDIAIEELLTKNPRASIDKRKNVASRAIAEKAKELGVPIPRDEINTHLSKIFTKESRQFETPEEISDRMKRLNTAFRVSIGRASREKTPEAQRRKTSSLLRQLVPDARQSEINTLLKAEFPKEKGTGDLPERRFAHQLTREEKLDKEKAEEKAEKAKEKALKRISDIERTKTLLKSKIITRETLGEIGKLVPELEKDLGGSQGQKLSSEEYAKIEATFDEEVNHLRKRHGLNATEIAPPPKKLRSAEEAMAQASAETNIPKRTEGEIKDDLMKTGGMTEQEAVDYIKTLRIKKPEAFKD